MGNILLLRCDVANKSIYIDLCLCDKRFSKGKKGAEKVKMLDLVSFNPLVACKLRESQKIRCSHFVILCSRGLSEM